MSIPRTRPGRLVLLAILAAALGSAGCGSYGNIRGTVKYGDKIVKSGMVYFYPKQSDAQEPEPIGKAPITAEGTYTMNKVPVGPVIVCVNTDIGKPNRYAASMKMPGATAHDIDTSTTPYASGGGNSAENYVPIPRKYFNPQSSGQEYTVTSGRQDHDIELPVVN